MSEKKEARSNSERWAEFKFSVVGPLLSSPPRPGDLRAALKELAKRTWRHPLTGAEVRYAFSTIERWYYRLAREHGLPLEALQRRVRSDRAKVRVFSVELKEAIENQYRAHPSWSYKLHWDNLLATFGESCPSYSALRRYMQANGFFKKRRLRARRAQSEAQLQAQKRCDNKEIRSYEVEHVGALWHLDFHHARRQLLTKGGQWKTPICLSVIDDRSRLVCHLQWYFSEDTKCLVHGFCQALQKRGLPRALLSDNGAAMTSIEFTTGLLTLGIRAETTLPYMPCQNGKQERLFAVVEGRLMAMLEGYKELTLDELNRASIAWVEREYNRTRHEELDSTPLEVFLNTKDVHRTCPDSKELKQAFRRAVTRCQRQSDGTISIENTRFEVPERFRHFRKLRIHYAPWDLKLVHIADKDTGKVLCPLYPLDKQTNADGKRRARCETQQHEVPTSEVAPLLQKLIADYAATGLPPAYIASGDDDDNNEK